MILLDTDILIDVLRGYRPAVEWFGSLGSTRILMSGFSALEVLQGCRNRREVDRILRLLAPHRLVWPGRSEYDRVFADYALDRLDRKVALLDVLIGETAAGLDMPLHTFNVRHFRAIPGVRTVQPYPKKR